MQQENELCIEGEQGINIKDVMKQIPNNTMKKFYIQSLNKVIEDTKPYLLEIVEYFKEDNSLQAEMSNLNTAIKEIEKLEQSNFDVLSDFPITPLIFVSLSYMKVMLNIKKGEQTLDLTENDFLISGKINKTIYLIEHWKILDIKIREFPIEEIYNLYDYITEEQTKNKLLCEIKNYYNEMF